MALKGKNEKVTRVIYSRYWKMVTRSFVFLTSSMVILFVIRGTDYLLAGLFVSFMYFLSLLFSKNIISIEVKDSYLITFRFTYLCFFEKTVSYEIFSLFVKIKRIVSLKGGVNESIIFNRLSDNKKVIEVSVLDLRNKEDFKFLVDLFKIEA
jgi:hypothetical protein